MSNRYFTQNILSSVKPERFQPRRVKQFFVINSLVLMTLLLSVSLSAAQEPTAQLALQRSPVQDDRQLLVDVHLSNLVELYGADIQISYDKTKLEVRDQVGHLDGIQVVPGPLLPPDDRLVVINETEEGVITLVVTLLSPAEPVSGEGVISTIAFEVIGTGETTLEVASAKLVAQNLSPLAVSSTGLALELGPEIIVRGTPTAQPTEQPNDPTIRDDTPETIFNASVVIFSGMLIGVVITVLMVVNWSKISTVATPEPLTQAEGDRRMPSSTYSTGRSSNILTCQGDQAAQAGNIERAYQLYSQAIELDPGNALAWLGKGLVAQQASEKRICLQRALALAPDNAAVKQALLELEG